MTTQTSAAPTSVPARAAAARSMARKPTATVPDQYDTTGAWILSIVCALMALTIGVALYLAKQMQL